MILGVWSGTRKLAGNGVPGDVFSNWNYLHVARNPVYAPWSSLCQIRSFYSFCRLVESVRVTWNQWGSEFPPASTIEKNCSKYLRRCLKGLFGLLRPLQ